MKKLRRMNKKGAIEMSINTIVILLLALAMLGVGMFVINKLRESVTELDVTQQKKDQIYNRLESSGGKFVLDEKEISVKSTETYRSYYGLENVLTDTTEFKVDIMCFGGLKGDTSPQINFYNRGTVSLNGGERTVEAFDIDPGEQVTNDLYSCKITVTDGDSEYASERFNLEVVP